MAGHCSTVRLAHRGSAALAATSANQTTGIALALDAGEAEPGPRIGPAMLHVDRFPILEFIIAGDDGGDLVRIAHAAEW